MKEKRFAIALPDFLIKQIDERGESRPKTIQKDLSSLYSLEFFTLYELRNKFTSDELGWLALHCVQGLGYYPAVEPKSALLNNIATAVDKESFAMLKKWCKKEDRYRCDEDLKTMEKMRDKIYRKVEKLTVFQAYCLIRTIEIAFEGAENNVITVDQLSSIFSPQGHIEGR